MSKVEEQQVWFPQKRERFFKHSAYDAAGTRTLRRTISGGIPTLTVYAFGLEEHSYSSNGTLQNNTYYYSLNGRLIGELTGLTTQTTNILLTDPLGSVVATFSNTAGSAALTGNQAYGPYGHLRYNAGGLSGMATSKGFTGQYSDAFSGLDYYQSRYYEPAVGVFLSADSKEGNTLGMDSYMYVGGNPQTYNDPTGEFYAPPPQGNGSPPPTCQQVSTCWSSSGGSGHPPTSGNNPPPTKPTNHGVKLPGGCDAQCQRDRILLQKHDYDMENRSLAAVALFEDFTSILGEAFAFAIDWGDWAKEILNGSEILLHLISFGINLARVFGTSIPTWLGNVEAGIRSVLAILDFARSAFDFIGDVLDPVQLAARPLLDRLVSFFAAQAKARIAEGFALLAGPFGALIGEGGGEGGVYAYWNGQLNADGNLNAAAAYQKCRTIYAAGVC
jgi:RHS repeat-associated protein